MSPPAGKDAHLAYSSVSWASLTPPGLQPNGFYFLTSPHNYSNKPITSSPESLRASYYCLPQPLLVHSVPGATPMCPAWYVLSSFPGLWVYVTLSCCGSHLSTVGCCVFGHPQIPRMDSLSHQQGEEEANKKWADISSNTKWNFHWELVPNSPSVGVLLLGYFQIEINFNWNDVSWNWPLLISGPLSFLSCSF